MRTKDAQGTVLEELYYEFPSPLGELPAGSPSTTDPDIVTSTDAMDGTNVQFDFTINTPSFATADEVYFVYPHGFKWNSAPQGTTVGDCGGTYRTGSVSDYKKFTHHQGAQVLYTSAGSHGAGNFLSCYQVDQHSLWQQTQNYLGVWQANPQIIVYITVSKEIQRYSVVETTNTITPGGTIVFEGVHPETTDYNMESKNLFRLQFDTTNRITGNGTIQVHFPDSHWVSVETPCYKIL